MKDFLIKMDNKTSYLTWLKQKMHRADNTIRAYNQYLKNLPELNLLADTEETICGHINTHLVQHPNQIAKSTCTNYIQYLFSEYAATNPEPHEFEQIRKKKNNILANIELPYDREKYELDLEQYYIPKKRLIYALKNTSTPIKQTIILLYDSGCRASELLKNDWKNTTTTEIYIPKTLSKNKRDRTINWLMPETKELIQTIHEDKGRIADTILGKNKPRTQYLQLWRSLYALKEQAFNPHSLRHTSLSDLAGIGWEIGALQRRAGHSNINQTQEYISWAGHKEERQLLNTWCEQHKINLKEMLGVD